MEKDVKMTGTTLAGVPWWEGPLPFVLAIGLASIGLAALCVFPAPYPNEPPLYGFLLFTLIFAVALPLCVWRMTLFVRMSRWTALYFLTATMMVPPLDPIIGTANRPIYLPVYVATVLGAYLLTKWALKSGRG
jgi:hypothetical protein